MATIHPKLQGICFSELTEENEQELLTALSDELFSTGELHISEYNSIYYYVDDMTISDHVCVNGHFWYDDGTWDYNPTDVEINQSYVENYIHFAMQWLFMHHVIN